MSAMPEGTSISAAELPPVAWRISGRSPNGSGNCVEAGPVRDDSGRVAVRHSHHPEGQAFVSTRDEWDAFLTGIKTGAYDFT